MAKNLKIKSLVNKVKAGNEDALAELFSIFTPLRKSMVLERSGTMIEAWDVEQEVNIAIYKACLDYDEAKMDSPIAYIQIRVRQAISDYIKKIARQGWFNQQSGRCIDIEQYEQFLGENGYISSSSEERCFDKWLVEDCLEDLTDKQKQVAEFLLKNYTQREIAERMGVSQQAISKHVKLIRAKLNKNWAEEK